MSNYALLSLESFHFMKCTTTSIMLHLTMLGRDCTGLQKEDMNGNLLSTNRIKLN